MKRYVKIMAIALFAVMQTGSVRASYLGDAKNLFFGAAAVVCGVVSCQQFFGAKKATATDYILPVVQFGGAVALYSLTYQGINRTLDHIVTKVAEVFVSGANDGAEKTEIKLWQKVAAGMVVTMGASFALPYASYKISRWQLRQDCLGLIKDMEFALNFREALEKASKNESNNIIKNAPNNDQPVDIHKKYVNVLSEHSFLADYQEGIESAFKKEEEIKKFDDTKIQLWSFLNWAATTKKKALIEKMKENSLFSDEEIKPLIGEDNPLMKTVMEYLASVESDDELESIENRSEENSQNSESFEKNENEKEKLQKKKKK